MSDSQPTADPARSYGSVAEAYHRGRPGYPVEAVRWMLGDEPRIVLELGAGTGKLTSVMVEAGHAVHACEPDAAMFDVLEREVPGASSRQVAAAVRHSWRTLPVTKVVTLVSSLGVS